MIFDFFMLFLIKDSVFIAVKSDAKSLTRYVKGVQFFNRRNTTI